MMIQNKNHTIKFGYQRNDKNRHYELSQWRHNPGLCIFINWILTPLSGSGRLMCDDAVITNSGYPNKSQDLRKKRDYREIPGQARDDKTNVNLTKIMVSCSDTLPKLKSLLAYFVMLFMLAACGFKPVYSERYDGDIELSLSEIKIGALNCKRGYKLKNYIEDQLDPHQLLSHKKYTLDVNVADNVSDLLVQQDSTITKKQHNILTSYILKDDTTNTVLDKGDINIAVSYSELPSEYATYAIGERSYDNALKEIAIELKKHLVTALSQSQETELNENQSS